MKKFLVFLTINETNFSNYLSFTMGVQLPVMIMSLEDKPSISLLFYNKTYSWNISVDRINLDIF